MALSAGSAHKKKRSFRFGKLRKDIDDWLLLAADYIVVVELQISNGLTLCQNQLGERVTLQVESVEIEIVAAIHLRNQTVVRNQRSQQRERRHLQCGNLSVLARQLLHKQAVVYADSAKTVTTAVEFLEVCELVEINRALKVVVAAVELCEQLAILDI